MADPTNPGSNTGRAGAEDVKNQSEFYELLVQSTAKAERLLELAKERNEVLKSDLDLLEKETKLSSF